MSTNRHHRVAKIPLLVVSAAVTSLSGNVAQASVDIASGPLFLSSGVEPNILYILDDSGSMNNSFIPDNICDLRQTNRAKSASFNTLYYDPDVTYLPPLDHNGDPLPNASFLAARMDGYSGSSPVVDLSTDYRATWSGSGTGSCDTSDYADSSGQPAYYYVFDDSATGGDAVTLTAQGPYGTFSSRRQEYSIPELAQITSIRFRSGSSCSSGEYGFFPGTNVLWTDDYCRNAYFDISGITASCSGSPDEDACYRRVIVADDSGPGGVDERTNFANWYQYYRTRLMTAKAGSSRAFATLGPAPRVGYGRINRSSTLERGVRPFDGADRQQFFDWLRGMDASGLTPLRRALDAAGQYFSDDSIDGPYSSRPGRTDGEVISCRQNFTILMSDGYWNSDRAATSAARNNNDNTSGPTVNGPGGSSFTYAAVSPFRDGYSDTLADVAMYYWKNDLADLRNDVPTTPGNPAFWQHMVTFGVGLGVPTQVDPVDAFAAIDSGVSVTWPDPEVGFTGFSNLPPGRADDLLHAAVNGRGGFFNAQNPRDFANRLAETLFTIVSSVESSATSASTSSAVLQTDTLVYTAGFRSGDWSGQLDAREVNLDGTLAETAEWDAEARLAARDPDSRRIFTRQSPAAAGGVLFEFDELSTAQRDALNTNTDGDIDSLGAERVAWLRGTEFGVDDTRFRSRSISGRPRLLGDIVNSNPQFRNGVLYVGANDGMLHAFDGATGEELFAYIPSVLLMPDTDLGGAAPINRVMHPDYPDEGHRYFVDGTPAVVDVYEGASKRTVLIGSMGAGGRTIFALDVTDPDAFSASDVMWEFTHPDLGYRVGQPAVVELNDGRMAAIFGNGYNSDSGSAVLFVVDLETGNLIEAIDTGAAGSNGLGAPAVTDWPDGNLRAGRVYAGDLEGNLWRFDLRNPVSSAWPAPVAVFTATTDNPLDRQPITAAPVLALNPADDSELIIAFGTGSYFRNVDRLDTQTQSLYGIIDTVVGASGITRGALRRQTVTTESMVVDETTLDVRVLSEDALSGSQKGWFVDLPAAGERVVSAATFPSGPVQNRVRFSTLIPDNDPCGGGLSGFLMDIDLATGGRTQKSVFDLNRDGAYDEDDMYDGLPVSGLAWGTGELPTRLTPPDQAGDPVEFLYTGEGESVRGLGEEGFGGRQSWQQVR